MKEYLDFKHLSRINKELFDSNYVNNNISSSLEYTILILYPKNEIIELCIDEVSHYIFQNIDVEYTIDSSKKVTIIEDSFHIKHMSMLDFIDGIEGLIVNKILFYDEISAMNVEEYNYYTNKKGEK